MLLPTGLDSSPCRSYVIRATPRGGGNFLREVPRGSGIAGNPDDYFWNPGYWQELWGARGFRAYLVRILEEGTSPNQVFGCKMMRGYLAELVPQLATLFEIDARDPCTVREAAFPNLRYVWLTRRDKVRQGVSFYRALETNRWRSTDRGAVGVAVPPFSFEAIDRLAQLSTGEDDEWGKTLQARGVSPLVVTYEDLAADPVSVANRVLAFLDLPARSTSPAAWRHERQADTLTDAWAERYWSIKAGQSG